MGVFPNPKMAFIFPISCILALIFPILIKYFPKCIGKGSFPKSKINITALAFLNVYHMQADSSNDASKTNEYCLLKILWRFNKDEQDE